MGKLAQRLVASAPGVADEGHWTSISGTPRSLGRWLVNLLSEAPSATGRKLTASDVVTLPIVYRGIMLLATLPAFLPLKVLKSREGGTGADPYRDHYAYPLLYHAPNPWQTSFQWRVAMGMSAHFRGTGYSALIWNRDGTLDRIHWLHPDRVEVYLDGDGYPVYRVWMSPAKTNPDDAVWLSRFEMHTLWFETLNGYTGCTAIEVCRESGALAIAQREIAERLMSNGAKPSGILSLPAGMDSEAKAAAKLSWEEAHKGYGKAGRTAVLPIDHKYTPLSFTMEDAQWIEATKLSREDWASALGIQPDFLSISAGAMGGVTGVEQRKMMLMATRLDPILVAWEQAIQRDILSPDDLDVAYPRFNRNALLRTDLLTRYRVYAIARMWGLKNADQCRALEDENPIGGEAGETYLNPQNMDRLGYDPSGDPTAYLDGPAGSADAGDAPELEAFAPLLERALTRVYKRAQQDLPAAERRGNLAGWREAHRRYAADELVPLLAVLPAGEAQPLRLLEPESAAAADPAELARRETGRLLGLAKGSKD